MKVIANIVLILLIALLGYMLFNSIKEPIAFQEGKNLRASAVSNKLTDIRKTQEIYKSITGSYAGSFDLLVNTLRNDSIPFEKILGDPDDPTNADKFIREITLVPAIDSIRAMKINLDSLRYIPFTAGKTFDIQADTIEYQSTQVNVVQVGTKWKEFMGPFADKRFAKYDKSYDPEKLFKFGDMGSPSLSGNWE